MKVAFPFLYEERERERKFMNAKDIAIYREIQRNAQMGIQAIDAIADKVYDDQLTREISRQSMDYSSLRKKAYDELVKAKEEPYQEGKMSHLMLVSGIRMNTLFNSSTGHIAEMMIKGSNMGLIEMNKVLNHNKEAGEEATALAHELIGLEKRSVESLNTYL